MNGWNKTGVIIIIISIIVIIVTALTAYQLTTDPNARVASIAVVVGMAVTIITTYYQGITQQTSGLIRAFDLLNTPEHRKVRASVCQAYESFVSDRNLKPEDFKGEKLPLENILEGKSGEEYEKLLLDIEKVTTDFDQIASLIKNNLMPRDAFMDAYWGTTVRCWGALHGYVKERREIQTDHFMTNFEKLSNWAIAYWEKHHHDIPIRYYDLSNQTN